MKTFKGDIFLFLFLQITKKKCYQQHANKKFLHATLGTKVINSLPL